MNNNQDPASGECTGCLRFLKAELRDLPHIVMAGGPSENSFARCWKSATSADSLAFAWDGTSSNRRIPRRSADGFGRFYG